MSVIYRDRERDREWDTRSTGGRSTTYRDSDREREGYSIKKIYRIPNRDVEEDRLSIYRGDDRRSERERDVQETRIVRRERSPEPEPERREIHIVREERSRERQPEPRHVEREIRYERDLERLAPARGPYENDRGDLQRYSRSVEYFPRPDPPQPIIIRQEPQQIIIQEAPRAPITVPVPVPVAQKDESEFQLVHRSEVAEDRQVARRPKSEKDNEEEYYYERRTREVSRDNRGRDDDYEEERYRRRDRDVSPGDSISQVGGRGRRRYSSDDSYEYVERRETREGYDSDEGSPHHRRHLAEGAIAGVGAAELLRHHRKKEGGEGGSRRGRVGKDVGAAALGAIGAEAVTRARSHIREKSKSRRGSHERSRSRDRDGRRRHRRERSKSRSRSKSRIRQAATLGLGAAAVAAAAAYANKQRKNNDGGRRSRSRTRRDSVGAAEDADDARNPAHRNKKIAQAGLAGAAVAGLVERARSKSRGGRERSKSRIRTGIPIAAAGLGSAAIAGLYEKNQAGKKEKEARREERTSRRASRSQSRSQHYEGSRDHAHGNRDMIEYGDTPIYGHNGVPDYYNRPASQQGYYNNTEAAMIPAAAVGTGAAYGAPRERDRSRSISSGSDNDRRRRRRHRRHRSDSRSRSRSKGLAAAALGAGVGGIAASENEKRKQRKEEKRERREAAERASRGQDQYAQQPYSPPPGQGYPQGPEPYANQPFYPPHPGQPYSPSADYQAQGGQPVGAQIHPDYGYPPQQPGGYVPPDPNAYQPPPGTAPYVNPGPRRADENVSAEKPFHNAPSTFSTDNDDNTSVADANAPLYDSNGVPFYMSSGEGVITPRAASPITNTTANSRPALQRRATSQPPPRTKVRFNLSPQSDSPTSPTPSSPTKIRQRRQRASASSNASHHSSGYDSDDVNSRHRDSGRRHRRSDKARKDSRSPSPASSNSTIDLPERFDKYGRPLPGTGENDFADKFQEILEGKGSMGRLLKSWGLAGDGSNDDDGENGGRKRRRRR
ncbi:MAG: hypothetical protein Q9163_001646 [Psora crenata]